MSYQVDVAGFQELFRAVRGSSWRWECQGDYAVDHEELAAWQRGEPFESDDDRAWLDYIHGLAAAGIPFERVRMLTDPLTDYLRWMLDTTEGNVEAGEDIRWIAQADVVTLGMPSYDFYLFDNDRVVILLFDEEAELRGAHVDDDPRVVATHQRYRDHVWPLATPHREFIR